MACSLTLRLILRRLCVVTGLMRYASAVWGAGDTLHVKFRSKRALFGVIPEEKARRNVAPESAAAGSLRVRRPDHRNRLMRLLRQPAQRHSCPSCPATAARTCH